MYFSFAKIKIWAIPAHANHPKSRIYSIFVQMDFFEDGIFSTSAGVARRLRSIDPFLMNRKYGILICPDTHTACDVHASIWSHDEIRQKLSIGGNGEIVTRGLEPTGDTIIVSAFLNIATAGKASRCEGFNTRGEQFYGRALVIAGDENRTSPGDRSARYNRPCRELN